MGENGVNGHSNPNIREWKVGFMNTAKKYLTAESFGKKVNGLGVTMKKKEIWTIEQDINEKFVYIRSYHGGYLSTNKYGDITCGAEEKTETERFVVEYSSDGRWAFKHVLFENYLAFSEKEPTVRCFSKSPVSGEWWSIQLYIHPQINLKNVKRKRYAHLNGDALECTEVVPWGCDATIFLDFVEGKYAIKSYDNRYLCRDGSLQEAVEESALYNIEVHSGALAFKDCQGMYLTAVGQGTMKCTKPTVNQDQMFTIEDSNPQVQIISHNGKNVSIKQGIDVSANQEELEDTEIFQMEFDKASQRWAFRTITNRYWQYQPAAGGVQACLGDKDGKDYLFGIDWQEDGTVGISVSDGKYLSNKATGSLFASSSTLGEKETFRIIIVNRPRLVLKCEHGFVGTGTKAAQYICNKAKYDILQVTSTGTGSYHIQGEDGKFWGLGADQCVSNEETPSEFWFEFVAQSVMKIRGPNKLYLKAEQSGLLKAVAETAEFASELEY